MALDPDDLKEMREIMEDSMPDTAHVYRFKRVTGTPGEINMSDNFGGIILDTAKPDGADQREFIKTYICRGTVPRANRDQAEYSTWQQMSTETKIVLVMPHNADIKMTDGILYINESGNRLDLEVQVIAPHSDGITLQVNCMQIAEQPDLIIPS